MTPTEYADFVIHQANVLVVALVVAFAAALGLARFLLGWMLR